MIETKPPYEVFVSEVFDTDVCEEIRVFPDYIQYNTRCWPCWIDYSKLEYKLEWGKLLVKAFEYAYVDFDHQYEETDKFYLLRDWKLNSDEFNRYLDWYMKESPKEFLTKKKEKPDLQYTQKDRQEDIDRVSSVLNDAKKYSEWHEFKYIKWPERYSTKARKWIINKIENKDFD